MYRLPADRAEFASDTAFRKHHDHLGLVPKPKAWYAYPTVSIKGKAFGAHRFVFAMVNGPIPEGMEVDHKNGDIKDYRLDNLRLATKLQNARNTKAARAKYGVVEF